MATKTLQELLIECISTAKLTKPLTVQKGNLYQWKGRVTSSLTADLKCRCSPNYGLAIVDDTALVPCIIVDPIAAASKLLSMHDQTIVIRDPQFIVEVVSTESKQYDSVHLFLEPDNIKLPDPGPNITVPPLQLETTKAGSNEAFTCNIVPYRISSSILTTKCDVICLVLSTVIYQGEDRKEDVWLLLKNEQVIWKDFLIPNRNYTVYFPSQENVDDFKKYKSFHTIADKYLDLTHRQMFHHKDLIKTMAIALLPENTRISSNFTFYNEISTEDWFSISDDRLYHLKFASVYAVIKDINYLESWNMKNCPWCDPPNCTDRPECQSNAEKSHPNASGQKWSSLVPKFSSKSEDEIQFPQLKADPPQNKITGFGIRGGKINVQIVVQEISTECYSYVFLKRWKMEQYPAGLSKGVTVCFTNVNIKRSKKNNLYFVNTPLTRILYLNVFDTLRDTNNMGQFKFPYSICSSEKIWGPIELEMLAKISIATKCKLCKQTFARARCPNVFCSNHRKDLNDSLYEVTATARLFVRSMREFAGSTLYLKNEHVQKYLDVPQEIWRKFCRYSTIWEPLVYSHDFTGLSPENTDPMMMAFYIYCKHFRPKSRFHVCCKGFKGDSGEERKYFCFDLKEIGPDRPSAITAELRKHDVQQSECKSSVDTEN